MLIEERKTWIHDWKLIDTTADIISFGSESCTIPVLEINNSWNMFLQIIGSDKRVKIVTPRISQSDISSMLNLLNKIITLRRKLDIVINDWGIFYFCLRNIEHFNIHLGRQLSRSLLDCPWHNEILNNEKKITQEILTKHLFDVDTLKENGVSGIELNRLLPEIYYDSFNGLEISVHQNEYLLTCGKICLSKRIYPKKDCHELCNRRITIEPVGKWFGFFNNRVPFSDYEKSLLEGMNLTGKKVVMPQKNIDFSSSIYNVLIKE